MKIKPSKSNKKNKTLKSSAKKNKKPMVKTRDVDSGDIISLILRDHDDIKKFILVLKSSKVDITKKRPAYAEFERILSNHAKAEQESLYVHMKEEDEIRIAGLEGDIEHELVDQLMREIGLIKNDSDSWMAKVKVLAELVNHHVNEEEKSVLKQVRKKFNINTRIEIGKEYSNLLNQNPSARDQKLKYTDLSDARGEYV